MQNQGSMFGFMLDKNSRLPNGFKEFEKEFDDLNDEMVELLTNSSTFPERQMGTLKGKIKVPDDFDSAFADEIADVFAGA